MDVINHGKPACSVTNVNVNDDDRYTAAACDDASSVHNYIHASHSACSMTPPSLPHHSRSPVVTIVNNIPSLRTPSTCHLKKITVTTSVPLSVRNFVRASLLHCWRSGRVHGARVNLAGDIPYAFCFSSHFRTGSLFYSVISAYVLALVWFLYRLVPPRICSDCNSIKTGIFFIGNYYSQ